jgi:hypothetical protein
MQALWEDYVNRVQEIRDQLGPLDPELEFGKHKGKKLSEVHQEDPGYIKWLSETESVKERRGTVYYGARRRLRFPTKPVECSIVKKI